MINYTSTKAISNPTTNMALDILGNVANDAKGLWQTLFAVSELARDCMIEPETLLLCADTVSLMEDGMRQALQILEAERQ